MNDKEDTGRSYRNYTFVPDPGIFEISLHYGELYYDTRRTAQYEIPSQGAL
jgi:hypothetical protein